jgi:glutaredoxin
MTRILAVSVVWLVLASGCRQQDAPEQAPPVVVPTAPQVTDAPGPYVLRYFSATSGELTAVRTPAEVPPGARAQVIVSPEDPNAAGPWLFVADLTQKKGDHYDVHAVDRAKLEAQVVKPAAPMVKPAEVAAAPTAQGDVVIFRTSWCGYCKKTAEYLKLKGVPFIEKDLEQDPGAREDMLARARKAGVPESRLQGVPILSVRGHIITGFDRAAIDQALKG